jgi:ERCC4-type nuclease
MNCSIITDYRENACIEAFQNHNIQTQIKTLDIGDFWIVDENDAPLIIIERKRVDDFSSSLTSGRLHEQKHRLLTNADISGAKIMYILEGNLVYENQKIKNKPASAVYSALWSITLGRDIDLFQTKNAYHTCMCIDSICRKIRKKGKFWDEVLTKKSYEKVLSSKKRNNKNPEQCARDMLCCIHGVSYTIADIILNEFGNIHNLCSMIKEGKYRDIVDGLRTKTKTGKERKLPKKVVARLEEFLFPINNEQDEKDKQDEESQENLENKVINCEI